MKRMMMMIALAAFLVAALSVSALSAFAAPVTCQGEGLTVVKTGPGTFECVNSQEQGNPPEKSKNPNR